MSRALILVDLQNDFAHPAGTLYVRGGDTLTNNILRRMDRTDYSMVVASKDWHPYNHCSFASVHKQPPFTKLETGEMLWPDHCVQNTWGAEIADAYKPLMSRVHWIVNKGTQAGFDSYSAFQDSSGKSSHLTALLHAAEVTTVDVVGLATDYCVKETAFDAQFVNEFQVHVIRSCCAGVDPKTTVKAIEEMMANGVIIE